MNVPFSTQELNDELLKIALRTLERVRPLALSAEQRERFEDAYNTLKGLVGEDRAKRPPQPYALESD